MKSTPHRVKLNIGGTRFETTFSTLSKFGPNFFTKLIDGALPVIEDEDGSIFVDRSPESFKVLLEYLRTGFLSVPASIGFKNVLSDALFYSVDMSCAFLSDLEEGVYTSMNGHSTELLYIERHKDQPWLFGVTGVIKLKQHSRSGECLELWREEGSLVNSDYQITPSDKGLTFSQTTVFGAESNFVLLSPRGRPTSIDLKPDTWWTGSKFSQGQLVEFSFCHLEAGKWVLSVRCSGKVVGPFDVHFKCPNFFFVGTEDEQFWMLITAPNRLLTYRPFSGDKFNGRYARQECWMRFITV